MAETTTGLKKNLSLFDVYAVAMGTTLSSGFFLLPGFAFAEAGEGMVVSYVLAAVLVLPAVLSMAELATAMPKAGGAYYFLDRSMGPMVGTIGGLGTWLVLILKSAFALIGLGAYAGLFYPDLPILPLALVMALVLGAVNLAGAKKSSFLQVVLVMLLMIILTGFLGVGASELKASLFVDLFNSDGNSIFATAGLVYISYAGLTKVTSIAEEVKNPERNIPLGLFLALGSAVVVYALGMYLLVSLIPGEQLVTDLTPVSTAADLIFGPVGGLVLAGAAIMGFLAAANAGILSASRYPIAMGRDHLLPRWTRKVSAGGAPVPAILLTVALVLLVLLGLDPMKIAKLAGAFQLLLFALLCLAVIVMRESRIESYDPGFRSPMYPWVQIIGILSSLEIITLMGFLPALFSIALVGVGLAWYRHYASKHVARDGAIYHWFARLGERRYDGLDRELRGILKEKGLREEDPFDSIVAAAGVIEATPGTTFESAVEAAAALLSAETGQSASSIGAAFLEGTRIGATPVTHGVALPHFKSAGLKHPALVLLRAKTGIHVIANDPLTDHVDEQDVHAIFFLMSDEDNPGQHLRILAQIAGRVDDAHFREEWLGAVDETDLREVMLQDERFLSLPIRKSKPSGAWCDRALRDIRMPKGALVALVSREGSVHVPDGSTVLREGDRLTILGEPKILQTLRKEYLPGT